VARAGFAERVTKASAFKARWDSENAKHSSVQRYEPPFQSLRPYGVTRLDEMVTAINDHLSENQDRPRLVERPSSPEAFARMQERWEALGLPIEVEISRSHLRTNAPRRVT
jgi:hypothetical protein